MLHEVSISEYPGGSVVAHPDAMKISGKSFRFNFTSNRKAIYDIVRISKTQNGAMENCLISLGRMHDERIASKCSRCRVINLLLQCQQSIITLKFHNT